MMTQREYSDFFWVELDINFMQHAIQSWHEIYTSKLKFKKDFPTDQEVKDFDLSFCGC